MYMYIALRVSILLACKQYNYQGSNVRDNKFKLNTAKLANTINDRCENYTNRRTYLQNYLLFKIRMD